MALVPTLLVGLGGIGSRIVDEVQGMIPPSERDRIEIHTFDTNVNDISQLRNIGKQQITQTSAPWTVRQYLHQYPAFRRWFQDDQQEILEKTLTDGAGQIRSVSRLGFLAAIEEHQLKNIRDQFDKLFQVCSDQHLGSLRIMIVSSLAGGTGAGIFQQVALMLKDLAERRTHSLKINVRGAFVMPDILVRCDVIPPGQHENVQANGYACFKELDALNSNFVGMPVGIDQPLELEFSVFGGTTVIPVGKRPYEFAFLYDFENTRGQNLAAFDHYVQQVIKSTYLQLFSPMSNNQFSVEDNEIISFTEGKSRNRYGGTGVSSLLYPYQDMVDFLALQWSCASLGEEWLKLDKVYRLELLAWERDKQAGVQRPEPELARRYVTLLEDWAATQGNDPVYKEFLDSTRLPSAEGLQGGESKVDKYLDEVEGKILAIARENPEMRAFEGNCTLDEGALKIRDRAKSQVLTHEGRLAVYWDRVKKYVRENSTSIVYQSLLEDSAEPTGMGGQPLRLNTWLLGSREPLHPVAQRYFLYRLQLDLIQRVAALTEANSNLEKSIVDYEKAYDLTETRGEVETADRRIELALRQNRLTSLVNDRFKQFVAEYKTKSGRQKRSIALYKEEKLKELVFADILKKVNLLLELLEAYFRGLEDTWRVLQREAEAALLKHEQDTDPTVIYVLATRADKERLWDEHRLALSGYRLPADISREIFLGLYREMCERIRKPRALSGWGGTEAAFRRDVIGWCRGKIHDDTLVDFNVTRALHQEAVASGKNHDDHVRDELGKLNQLAFPWVQVTTRNEIQQWGAHPDCLRPEILPQQTQVDLFGGVAGAQGSKMVASRAFSPYEVIRYRSFYGLTADDFPQFSAEEPGIRAEGCYYRAYQKRILRLVETGGTVTPHLDKRWHEAAFLPDLNPERRQEELNRINKAFVLGLCHGLFRCEGRYGIPSWFYYDPKGMVDSLKIAGENVGGDPFLLHKALAYKAKLVMDVLQAVEDEFMVDKKRHKNAIAEYLFAKGSEKFGIVEHLWSFTKGDPSNPELRRTLLSGLLPLWIDETVKAFVRAYGEQQQARARQDAFTFIDGLVSQQSAMQAEDPAQWNDWNHEIERRRGHYR